MSAGAFVLASCLNSCKKSDSTPAIVDFTLDLTQSANSALNNIGGFIYQDGVIVAKSTTGNFIAVSQTCTHEGTTISYEGSQNRFHCPNHGSNFSETGAVINGPASSSLTKYNTALTGTSLRVFS